MHQLSIDIVLVPVVAFRLKIEGKFDAQVKRAGGKVKLQQKYEERFRRIFSDQNFEVVSLSKGSVLVDCRTRDLSKPLKVIQQNNFILHDPDKSKLAILKITSVEVPNLFRTEAQQLHQLCNNQQLSKYLEQAQVLIEKEKENQQRRLESLLSTKDKIVLEHAWRVMCTPYSQLESADKLLYQQIQTLQEGRSWEDRTKALASQLTEAGIVLAPGGENEEVNPEELKQEPCSPPQLSDTEKEVLFQMVKKREVDPYKLSPQVQSLLSEAGII
jgi:hypothetical protein